MVRLVHHGLPEDLANQIDPKLVAELVLSTAHGHSGRKHTLLAPMVTTTTRVIADYQIEALTSSDTQPLQKLLATAQKKDGVHYDYLR